MKIKTIPITTKNNDLMVNDLKKYLSKESFQLLSLYCANYTINKILTRFKIKNKHRSDIVLRFIILGKEIALFNLDGLLIPKQYTKEYLQGFNDCRHQLNKIKKEKHEYIQRGKKGSLR